MVKMIEMSNGEFIVASRDCDVHVIGSKLQAAYALRNCGIESRQVAKAFHAFKSEGHRYAEFGILGTLIYTDNVYCEDKVS